MLLDWLHRHRRRHWRHWPVGVWYLPHYSWSSFISLFHLHLTYSKCPSSLFTLSANFRLLNFIPQTPVRGEFFGSFYRRVIKTWADIESPRIVYLGLHWSIHVFLYLCRLFCIFLFVSSSLSNPISLLSIPGDTSKLHVTLWLTLSNGMVLRSQ